MRSWKEDMGVAGGHGGGLEVSLRSWKVTWERLGGYEDDPKVFMEESYGVGGLLKVLEGGYVSRGSGVVLEVREGR